MKFKLENPPHQSAAIQSVVEVFRGMERNTYDNAHMEDIHSNVCSLSRQEISNNLQRIISENRVHVNQAFIIEENDACIEMETVTGKTLTYIQTAYELFKQYGLSKYIVIVPSVPIRQRVIDTFENFKDQLTEKYEVTPDVFVYDSSKLSRLHNFITSDNIQIAVLTLASFNSENNILNQVEREGLFNNLPHLEAIAQTHPIIFMDEPQEGMNTDNSIQWIGKLKPMFKFRYSATYSVKKNVLYQLTPAESYRLGLVNEQKYRQVYAEFNGGKQPLDSEVEAIQGYYFAKTMQGEYADKEDACRKNKEIFDEILHNKQRLLSFESPIEFIFSHSALGVGWDNPNVFGIAALNESYSENKKRQEIGQGLRICVNQNGERIYDTDKTLDEEQINQLTIVPNATYETFARSYQQEYEELYGSGAKIPNPKRTHKGKRVNRITFKVKKDETFMSMFRRFWNTVAKKTSYRIHMDEDELIRKSTASLKEIRISDYTIDMQSMRFTDISNVSTAEYVGSESYFGKAIFNPHDLIEEISEKTGLCYTSVVKIIAGIDSKEQYIKNPIVFMEQAV